ncbi:MAG: hypothetical protein CMI73_02365 [Candidatus Pelagibacter sp.]|nr:hypothetical protein [Candidatus Pelagibacter sp.]OUV87737.1 MAG: hypothetical protein CBC96_01765 [Pelagibacteraceae bacterium TMED136]|tara:strand:+ start:1982 stop:3199 length:1218 start_codon:yes stop_codon:yes gene_type:complete
MINFDNSFFFRKNEFNFKNNKNFKKNLINAQSKSEEILKEFSTGSNQILQSFTKQYQKKIRDLKQDLNFKNKKKVVIGIGGSSSGAKALSFFLKDDIIYFDNLDFEYFKNFFLKNNIKDYIFFIISKSGDTFETLALLNLLIVESRKFENYNIFKSMVVITENQESILKSFVNKNNIKIVEHNPDIGGRFSILSETGMLPFTDLNLNVEDGSEKFISLLNQDSDLSPTKNAAIILTCLEEMKLSIYCNLIYNYRLKHFSYWFHQLHGESLGKTNKALTPTTSICPKDHHSMMQLYLGGPKNKFFNIFSPQDDILYDNFSEEGFYNIEHYTPNGLLKKQYQSAVDVFTEKGIPHRRIEITDHQNPLNVIELFSYFLLETILLGKMMNINPYGQPEVQLLKNKIFKN